MYLLVLVGLDVLCGLRGNHTLLVFTKKIAASNEINDAPFVFEANHIKNSSLDYLMHLSGSVVGVMVIMQDLPIKCPGAPQTVKSDWPLKTVCQFLPIEEEYLLRH